jgi:hypothetical protein
MQDCKAVLYHWQALAAGLVAVVAAIAVIFAEVSTRQRLKGVKRAKISWNYFYITLGFALTISGTIIQMLDFLHFPCNLLLYVVTAAVLFWLFLRSRWFRNELIGLQHRIESR